MTRWLMPLVAIVALLLVPYNAFALTSQNVTVTANVSYICISNTPNTWVINDVAGAGSKFILPNTTYYSNPLGDTAVPSDPVVTGECRFLVDNTSSVTIDLTVNFPDMAGGDASTNNNTGNNTATQFGALSYCTGMTYSTQNVTAKSSGSTAMKELATSNNVTWGLTYVSQSNAWTSGSPMTSTVVITATLHI